MLTEFQRNIHFIDAQIGAKLIARTVLPEFYCGVSGSGGSGCGQGSPSGKEQADYERSELQRCNTDSKAGKPVVFFDGLHSRPLRAQISVIPIFWMIAIGMIGLGSYIGILGDRRNTVAGWLIFVCGIAVQLGVLDLLIANIE